MDDDDDDDNIEYSDDGPIVQASAPTLVPPIKAIASSRRAAAASYSNNLQREGDAGGAVAIPIETNSSVEDDTSMQDTKKKACTGRTGWYATIGSLFVVLVIVIAVVASSNAKTSSVTSSPKQHFLYGLYYSNFFIFQHIFDGSSNSQ